MVERRRKAVSRRQYGRDLVEMFDPAEVVETEVATKTAFSQNLFTNGK